MPIRICPAHQPILARQEDNFKRARRDEKNRRIFAGDFDLSQISIAFRRRTERMTERALFQRLFCLVAQDERSGVGWTDKPTTKKSLELMENRLDSIKMGAITGKTVISSTIGNRVRLGLHSMSR